MNSLSGFYRDYGEQPDRPLPVAQWHPPFCGDINMRIAFDGTWFYNGTPVERPNMVRLFSRILRREQDRYFLVTPAEKVGIRVEDAPFIATGMTVAGGKLIFDTNVGDSVPADSHHPLRFQSDADGFKPYVHVRDGLEARLSRQLAQDLANLAEVEAGWLGIRSADCFFPILPEMETPS